MKFESKVWSVVLTLAILAWAVAAAAQEDIRAHRGCVHCGMDRNAFGYSRMLVEYADGAQVGVCSLRCAMVELGANPDRKVARLRVADRDTRELLDAERAVWVMGGSKSGVMTRVPKWAFADEPGAQAFIEQYGGEIVPWEEAAAAARKELSR